MRYDITSHIIPEKVGSDHLEFKISCLDPQAQEVTFHREPGVIGELTGTIIRSPDYAFDAEDLHSSSMELNRAIFNAVSALMKNNGHSPHVQFKKSVSNRLHYLTDRRPFTIHDVAVIEDLKVHEHYTREGVDRRLIQEYKTLIKGYAEMTVVNIIPSVIKHLAHDNEQTFTTYDLNQKRLLDKRWFFFERGFWPIPYSSYMFTFSQLDIDAPEFVDLKEDVDYMKWHMERLALNHMAYDFERDLTTLSIDPSDPLAHLDDDRALAFVTQRMNLSAQAVNPALYESLKSLQGVKHGISRKTLLDHGDFFLCNLQGTQLEYATLNASG